VRYTRVRRKEQESITRDPRRDEDEHFVDEVLAQKRLRNRWATFEKQRLHAFLRQRAQLLL
jgi:hypothetical protein